MAKIIFNKPSVVGHELDYVREAAESAHLGGDGPFTKKCQAWLERATGTERALLTHSCTAALEMAALLCDLKEGDEVILPSYTFPSTANAFALRGARLVFVDIKPQTMNINGALVEQAITEKTKAIVVMHYAGFGCDMDPIMDLARARGLFVIEDAAQALMSRYKGRSLGSIGHFGCVSFHETKNLQCGEGGALLINDPRFIARAEIIREKGTDRSRFFRGEVDKYGWVDIGSSYVPSELSAAFLYGQLEKARAVSDNRVASWTYYFERLKPLAEQRHVALRMMPNQFDHNAHLFYVKAGDEAERDALIAFLKAREISSAFHYVPLHSSAAGKKFGRFAGKDEWTTRESGRLLRLPMYYDLARADQDVVIDALYNFYGARRSVPSDRAAVLSSARP